MNASNRITLTQANEPVTTAKGVTYFRASFKRGPLGRTVSRTFYARAKPDGSLLWERATPDELRSLVGQDFTGDVFIEAFETEPHEITIGSTGEVLTMTSRTIVRFADETVEQAMSQYGIKPRKAPEPAPSVSLLPSRNGHGVPA